jgi:hypothetical protein
MHAAPRFVVATLLLAACVHVVPSAPQHLPVQASRDARTLVEPDLAGACRRYHAGFEDRPTVLACGKWMFFYETFGMGGVPSSLPRFLVRAFPDEIGHGFTKLGMIEDPRSHDHLPFGMARGKMEGLATSIAWTCASCHVARIPDGRIVIGAPNDRYAYGAQVLMMTMFPFVATSGPKGHDPDAVAVIQPLLDRLKAKPQIWAALGGSLMLAMGAFKWPNLPAEIEHMYATWPTGTLDFLLKPLPLDDQVEVVGKIPLLFDLPRDPTSDHDRMIHAMLGWSGNAHSLIAFMHGFIGLGGGKPSAWSDHELRPIIEYIYSLEAPKNLSPPPAAGVAAGRALFHEKKCDACHDGPHHAGRKLYPLDEIGTDGELARWLDPTHTGKPCCKVEIDDPLTRAVKAPALLALWLQNRFLHNGSLSSLEQLFCLAPRPTRAPPMSSSGHMQTCEGLTPDEKHALIDYLRAL